MKLSIALAICSVLLAGCSGNGGGFATSPPPASPPPVSTPGASVSISPSISSIPLGGSTQFTATVANLSNAAVSWAVNGATGGNLSSGLISSDGLYTAPSDLPEAAIVTISATSQSAPSVSGSATVTITSDVVVGLAPAQATLELGASQAFSATVAGSGHPNTSVIWHLTGCTGIACGSVTAVGIYTAPQSLPAPPTLSLVAQSIADSSKSAAAAITVTSHFTLSISGPAAVLVGSSATYTAALTPAPNSNPATGIMWTISGSGCSGAACGTITRAAADTAIYQPPASLGAPASVTIVAVPVADASKAASISVAVNPLATVSLFPESATLAVSHRQTFTASITGGSAGGVSWAVAGIAGGNSNVGQLCAAGSNPCAPVATGGSVDYLAPASVPTPNPVVLTASSSANPAQMATAPITILPHISVTVSPPSETIAAASALQFAATVLGTSDQAVTWNVGGPACVIGGCGGIDATGLYTAPVSAPSPDTISIIATSSEDTSRTGSASVTITTAPVITGLLPASILSGAAGGFTLRVEGGNFVAAAATPGSQIYFGDTAHTTICPDAGNCITTLAASDLQAAGNFTVQVENPDGTKSAAVNFVVAQDTDAVDIIPVAPGEPVALARDIVVVEPSTAGSLAPQADVTLSIQAMGLYSTATSTCTLGASPLVIQRPASGTATIDICAFSVSGLGPSLTFTVSGPAVPDIIVAGAQPLGLGIVDLTLTVPASAQTGPRSLFIVNSNKDKAIASGSLEVQE